MTWYVVCDMTHMIEGDEDLNNPHLRIWTVSQNPDIPGWNTDGGHHGYGLSQSEAHTLAGSANSWDQYRSREAFNRR
jgi:hypothetical protein